MNEENKNNEQNSTEDSKEQKTIKVEVHIGKIPTREFPIELLLPFILKNVSGGECHKCKKDDCPKNNSPENIIKDEYITKNGLKVDGNASSLGTILAEIFNKEMRCLQLGELKFDYELKDNCLTLIGSENLDIKHKDFQDFIEWSHQYAVKNNLILKYFRPIEKSFLEYLTKEHGYEFESSGRKCLVKSFQNTQAA